MDVGGWLRRQAGVIGHGQAIAAGLSGSAIKRRVTAGHWVRLLTAAADRACSQAERLLVRLLRDADITGWELGYRCQDYVIDVAFPAQRLAIEIDGWAWHVTHDRFVRDRQRQNAVINAGWRLLRFTWHDLTRRPDVVLDDIRTALHRSATR